MSQSQRDKSVLLATQQLTERRQSVGHCAHSHGDAHAQECDQLRELKTSVSLVLRHEKMHGKSWKFVEL